MSESLAKAAGSRSERSSSASKSGRVPILRKRLLSFTSSHGGSS